MLNRLPKLWLLDMKRRKGLVCQVRAFVLRGNNPSETGSKQVPAKSRPNELCSHALPQPT